MSSILSNKILSTITYYNVMEYPMTTFEIWKYLINVNNGQGKTEDKKENYSLADVSKELESNELKNKIDKKQGFYFLKGKENLVSERLRRNKISEEKFKKIKNAVKWMRFVPFVKMIAVAGRVAAKNAGNESDLDIFIIFKKGKIFTGRFLVTALMHFLGKRRHKEKINNRICFNHFISDENEIFVKDLYSSHAYSFLMPVFGEKKFLDFQNKNEWIKKYRPNFKVGDGNLKIIKDTYFSFIFRNFLEKIFYFSWLEKNMKDWQLKKIQKNPKTKKAGGVIICNEKEMAFWPDFEKQGPKIFEKFQKNLKNL